MLEEHEVRLLRKAMRAAAPASATDAAAMDAVFQEALDAYERITGVHETVFAALAHHVVGLYGPPCHNCGRPLRTPKAQLCGSCMAPRREVAEMATAKQRAAARKNITKAATAARRKKTISKLSKKTSTAREGRRESRQT